MRDKDYARYQPHGQTVHIVDKRTWSTSTNTLSVVALLQETVDTTDGELETRLRRTRLRFAAGLSTRRLATGLGLAASLARHCSWFGGLVERVEW